MKFIILTVLEKEFSEHQVLQQVNEPYITIYNNGNFLLKSVHTFEQYLVTSVQNVKFASEEYMIFLNT